MAYNFGGTNLKKGASGDSVKKIQEALNNHGYGLTVDGVWGDNTDNALKDYQGKNGLTVDGIYGVNTHNALFGIAGNNTPQKPTEPESYSNKNLSKYDGGFDAENDGDITAAKENKNDAQTAWDNWKADDFSNQEYLDNVMKDILGRKDFSYDLNGDALYQQYKDKYIQQGKMAMQDTMGQAAAMTGGYGNSYAATVGNQAYQASLENLNDIVPELYQMAYDKYNQEGQDLYNQYGLLSNEKDREYAMQMDEYNRLTDSLNYYSDEENNIFNRKYGEWSDNRNYDTNQYWNETNFGYGKYRDEVSDWENERSFLEAQRQFNEQQALRENQAESGGSGGTGGSGLTEAVDSQAVQGFKAAIKTKNEFYTRGGSDKSTYGTYENYIEGIMSKWLDEGKLTEAEAETLIAYYGLV